MVEFLQLMPLNLSVGVYVFVQYWSTKVEGEPVLQIDE